MTTINELKQAITENKILVWNDPDYIEGGDYTINFIEDIDEELFDEDTPILIQYGKRSEAEVYLNEIVEQTAAEKRVYVVDADDENIEFYNATEVEIINHCEISGKIYSLKGFEEKFNSEELNLSNSFIRII